jgi:hypothetical protein
MDYWEFYYTELKKYADGEIDIRQMKLVESGKMELKLGTYFIFATGSFLSDWNGEKWKYSNTNEIRDEIICQWIENVEKNNGKR